MFFCPCLFQFVFADLNTGACSHRVLKCDITQNKFVKLWDLVPLANSASLKGVLAKNYLLIVIPSQNIKDESLILPHINLSNFESVPNTGGPSSRCELIVFSFLNVSIMYCTVE